MRGFFAVGVVKCKTEANIGTLWRTADIFGAAFCFTVGERYKRQASDTLQTWRHTPLVHYRDLDDLWEHIPYSCRVVGAELDERARPLAEYQHFERAIYLLGAEDNGLSPATIARCHDLVQLPGGSLNVAVAGSIVLYDRITRGTSRAPDVTWPVRRLEERTGA